MARSPPPPAVNLREASPTSLHPHGPCARHCPADSAQPAWFVVRTRLAARTTLGARVHLGERAIALCVLSNTGRPSERHRKFRRLTRSQSRAVNPQTGSGTWRSRAGPQSARGRCSLAGGRDPAGSLVDVSAPPTAPPVDNGGAGSLVQSLLAFCIEIISDPHRLCPSFSLI